MPEIECWDLGFPGAGRIILELSKVCPEKVEYYGPNVGHGLNLPPLKSKYLFLPAWHQMYREIYLNKNWIKPVIIWSSPPLQSEMVPQELEYLHEILHLLDAGNIHAIWFGHPGWLPLVMGEARRKVFYAPYPCTLPERWREKPLRERPKDVSLFGPLHPRKNVLNQLIAANIAGVKVHTTDALPQGLLKWAADVKLLGWLDPEIYDQVLLNEIDVGLQVSTPGVESFSFVTFDHISRGIPCLNTVSWTPVSTRVAHDDPEKIAAAIADSYSPADLRRWAEDYATRANRACLKTLASELGVAL